AGNTHQPTSKEFPMATKQATLTSFGRRLRQAREDADMTLDYVGRQAAEMLDPGSRSTLREKIRRYEADAMLEDNADPVIIAALANLYGVPMRDLSPTLTDRWAYWMTSLSPEFADENAVEDMESSFSRWITDAYSFPS